MLLKPAAGTPAVRSDLPFVEFVALIAAMIALTALAIDVMLPALGNIGEELGLAEDNHRQLVITFYLFGFSAGQIVFGPLSDRYGRKRPLYIGLVIFAVASILAALAETAPLLFAARALEGFGAASARIIAIAIVRDRFAGREMARVMSFVMMTFIVVPVFAPLLGQGIMVFAEWRWIFTSLLLASLALLGWVWLRLVETHAEEKRLPLTAGRLLFAVRSVLATRQTIGNALAFGCFFGILMGYIGSVEQIFVDLYGLKDSFPLVFAGIAIFMIPSFFLNSQLVRRAGMRRVSHYAILVFLGVCVAMALAGFPEKPPLLLFCLFIVTVFFCFGLIGPNLNAMAMEPMGHIAGTASSFIGFVTTACGAFFGFLIGQAFDGTVRPLTIGFTLLALAGLIIVFITEGGRLGQPQHEPPGSPKPRNRRLTRLRPQAYKMINFLTCAANQRALHMAGPRPSAGGKARNIRQRGFARGCNLRYGKADNMTGSQSGSIVIPCLTYKDANAAVEWLCRAFGFQEHAVYRDEAGQVVHGELAFGNGLIMIGPDGKGSLSAYMGTPERAGGLCTQTVSVIVDDPDAHHAKAKAEGAEILLEPTDKDYGGRDYTCRDLEGNIWSFGTYNPWTAGGSA